MDAKPEQGQSSVVQSSNAEDGADPECCCAAYNEAMRLIDSALEAKRKMRFQLMLMRQRLTLLEQTG